MYVVEGTSYSSQYGVTTNISKFESLMQLPETLIRIPYSVMYLDVTLGWMSLVDKSKADWRERRSLQYENIQWSIPRLYYTILSYLLQAGGLKCGAQFLGIIMDCVTQVNVCI